MSLLAIMKSYECVNGSNEWPTNMDLLLGHQMTKYNMNTNTAINPLLPQCYDSNHITTILKRQQGAPSSSSDCSLEPNDQCVQRETHYYS